MFMPRKDRGTLALLIDSLVAFILLSLLLACYLHIRASLRVDVYEQLRKELLELERRGARLRELTSNAEVLLRVLAPSGETPGLGILPWDPDLTLDDPCFVHFPLGGGGGFVLVLGGDSS